MKLSKKNMKNNAMAAAMPIQSNKISIQFIKPQM